MNRPGPILVAGNRHFVGVPAASVSDQLRRSTVLVPALKISIQSSREPSSSSRPESFLARNSEMITLSAENAEPAVDRASKKAKSFFMICTGAGLKLANEKRRSQQNCHP